MAEGLDHENYATRRFCAAMIHCAMEDASGSRQVRSRGKAVSWLASRAASFYFEPLGFTQSGFLVQSDWADWAHEVLANPGPYTPDAHLDLIRETLDWLDSQGLTG